MKKDSVFSQFKKNLKKIVAPLFLMVFAFAIQNTAVQAADGFVDCSKVAGNEMNVKCMTQIVGARCVIPTKDPNQCKWDQSILGKVVDLMVAFGPVLAVLLIMYGGYQYYFSGFTGQEKKAQQTVSAGVVGLIIITMVSMYRGFILSFTPEVGAANGVTYINLGQRLVLTILVPIVNVLRIGAAAFAILSLIFAGYSYASGVVTGDSSASKKGMMGLKNALIGILLVVLSITLSALLSNFVQSFK